jgi:cellulose synthase/poly-beta-1,6-N-acetylglucosamine synthase-like glycosyltransferase
MILDADSEVDPHYLDQALPLFDDPSVAAIAGHAFPSWEQHRRPTWRMFFVGYRVRLYKVTQAFLRYGQTWRYTNVSFIIPGFASMYRTSILPEIDISAPGLIIEDFNMTFEVHHKKLGKIAYTPRTRCMCQDPTTLRDYVKQVKRWDLGLWQTVRLHGVWPSVFWLSLATFMVEVTLQSAIFLTVPFVLVWFLIAPGDLLMFWLPFGSVELRALDVLVGVILADYLLTVIVAVLERKPMLMFYGLGFLVPRWIDAFLFLITLPMAFFVRSDGRWVSPQRS